MWERKRAENRQRVMEERKYFGCEGFGHVLVIVGMWEKRDQHRCP